MHFVFVHGWGFNAGIWRDLTGYMPNSASSLVDLGFIAGGPRGVSGWPSDSIAVGHSLGVLWLLHLSAGRDRPPFRGLVSIQGFDRFCLPVPRSEIAAMRRALRRNAYRTLEAFWRGCDTEPFAPSAALNVERLDEGLGWLLDWDARDVKAQLACPTLALASRDDAVVSVAMSAAMWGEDRIHWSETGGHVLPLKHPKWCADHVLDFAHALQP